MADKKKKYKIILEVEDDFSDTPSTAYNKNELHIDVKRAVENLNVTVESCTIEEIKST